jgi:hypothetical protein
MDDFMNKYDYDIINFDDADSLWEHISPTRINIKGGFSQKYFRGHANAEWKLIPAALRDGEFKNHYLISSPKNESDLIANEIATLQDYAHFCDKVGIRIPNDSAIFRSTYLQITSAENAPYYTNPVLWPNPKMYELMSMAQHHGVPTRLLDWSRNPYVAAYFASSGSLNHYEKANWSNERLAIWIASNDYPAKNNSLRFIEVPGSVSKHMSAQRGCFSIHPIRAYNIHISNPMGLEDYLYSTEGYKFSKLTLPNHQAPRLMHLCSFVGFSAAELFPTADGAGRALNDRIRYNAVIRLLNFNWDGSSKVPVQWPTTP